MKYRLGIDLGVGSIGTSVIKLNECDEATEIVDAGSRIFEVSEGAEDRRLKRTARKNLKRTKQRLDILAKKLHEYGLWVNESRDGDKYLRDKSPYKIRYNAVNSKLGNINFLGRAILHLAKHRGAGFVSAEEELKEDVVIEDNEKTKKSSPYDRMQEHLKQSKSKTIGEYFFKRIVESYGKNANNSKRTIRQKSYAIRENIVDYAIPRYLVKDEFNQIWKKQSEFYDILKNEKLRKEIFDILFYEKNPTPYATANCIYIKEETRLLKAHPLSEKRRIYEEVNNIKIITDINKQPLTKGQRDKIINELLMKGKTAGKKSIKEILNLSGQVKISLQDDKIIKPYLYSTDKFNLPFFKNLSEEEFNEFIEFLANPLINKNDENSRLLNENGLIEILKEKLKTSDEKQIGEILTKLPKGRGMLGKTATIMLINKMQEKVISHREATDEISKYDERFIAEEEQIRTQQGNYNELPYYGEILTNDVQPIPPFIKKYGKLNDCEREYGKISNPAVHMILNQLRLVINEIINIYGKPYEINIEVGRDVGMSTKKKKELENQQKANEKANEEAKKYLEENNLYINKNNILKYKLAKEQGFKDAYNPLLTIARNFSGFEIEHIIPEKKGGTDTYNNLCLVNRNDNLNKSDDFAYDYFSKTKSPEEIREILKQAREKTPNKSWRFEPDAKERFKEEGDKEETNRMLTDTRYVSKMACRYLRVILDFDNNKDNSSNRVIAIKGNHTAKLRKAWNLEGVEYELMGLNIPKYSDCEPYWIEENTGVKVLGPYEKKPDIDGNWHFKDKIKNPEWFAKPRIDHRHHAMDAITVAFANRSLISQMSFSDKKGFTMNKDEYSSPLKNIDSLSEFRDIVVDTLKDVRVSHKPEHGKQGELHKDTGRTKLCVNSNNKNAIITVYSRKIVDNLKNKSDLKKILISKSINTDWHEYIKKDKEAQEKLVAYFNDFYEEAYKQLFDENHADIESGKKGKNISEKMILQRTFRIIQNKGLWKSDKFRQYDSAESLIDIEKHGVVYNSGNNYCMDIYFLNNNIEAEVINRFDINNNNFIPKWKINNGKIIYTLHKGDLIEIDTPKEWGKYTNRKKCIAEVTKFRWGRNQLGIVLSTDARNGENIKNKPRYMQLDLLEDKSISFLKKHNARKIELTPFGKVKRKHKVLCDGKKKAS